MNGSDSPLLLRAFKQKDYAECLELFSAGMMEVITPMTKLVLYNYVPYAVLLLAVVAAIRWSLLDVLIYVTVCAILTLIAYFRVYLHGANYVKDCLKTDLQDIANYYKDGSCMFVAELDGKVVGMCAVVKKEHHKPGEAELKRMSVSSAIRNRGIGKKLVKIMEEFCKQHKYNKLILSTSTSQYAARALYSKCGFEVIGTAPFGIPGIERLTFSKDIEPDDCP